MVHITRAVLAAIVLSLSAVPTLAAPVVRDSNVLGARANVNTVLFTRGICASRPACLGDSSSTRPRTAPPPTIPPTDHIDPVTPTPFRQTARVQILAGMDPRTHLPALTPDGYSPGYSHGLDNSLHPTVSYNSNGDSGTSSPPPVVPNGPHHLALHAHGGSSSSPHPSHPGSHNGNNEITSTHPIAHDSPHPLAAHSAHSSIGSSISDSQLMIYGGPYNPWADHPAYGGPYFSDSHKRPSGEGSGGSPPSSRYSWGPLWPYPSNSSQFYSQSNSHVHSRGSHDSPARSDGSVSVYSAQRRLDSPRTQ